MLAALLIYCTSSSDWYALMELLNAFCFLIIVKTFDTIIETGEEV